VISDGIDFGGDNKVRFKLFHLG